MSRLKETNSTQKHNPHRNKGKLTGQKPPLQPKHVWAIRSHLQLTGRVRDLALFNLAIDSKLRGCDVVNIKVEDVVPHGYALDRTTVRQKKTGRPVKFELTDQTRKAIDEYLATVEKMPGDYLFEGRFEGRGLSTRQYARLVFGWISNIGLDPSLFRYSFTATNKSNVDLPSNRKSPSRPVTSGTFKS